MSRKIARGLFLTADLVKTNILRALIGPPMYLTGDHRTLPWTYSYFIRSRLLFGTARTVQDMILAITTFCTACPLRTHCFPYGGLSSPKENKNDLIC